MTVQLPEPGTLLALLSDGIAKIARFQPTALGLFGDHAEEIKSMAMVRMALWDPAREGLLVFGSQVVFLGGVLVALGGPGLGFAIDDDLARGADDPRSGGPGL